MPPRGYYTARKLLPEKKELERLYWGLGLAGRAIASRYQVSFRTVMNKMQELGIPRRSFRESMALVNSWKRGVNNPNYKNGITHTGKNGYILILKPDHPHTNNSGYVTEHRLVWEEEHNLLLPEGWLIHHKNGIKDDNRIENLVALEKKDHYYVIPVLRARIRELEVECEYYKEETKCQK